MNENGRIVSGTAFLYVVVATFITAQTEETVNDGLAI